MQNKSDALLLGEYAADRSEPAFAEIVARHTDLVYSVACRQTGSPQLAQEVAQRVFVDLARKARELPRDVVLTGWLYEAARFAGANAIRGERRRKVREQEALAMHDSTPESKPDWEQLCPVLDDAMVDLCAADRNAILLRYFHNQDFQTVGVALGVSDGAAQRRVSRAVERLREFFAKRGVAVGVQGLVVVISANAVQAAPAGLAGTISTAVLGGTTFTTTATATKAVAIITMQKFFIALAFFALLCAATYQAYRTKKPVPTTQLHNAADPLAPFAYWNDRMAEGPWSIHVFKVNRARSDLHFITTMGGENSLGVSVVSAQVKSVPAQLGKPIAAINGDFERSSGKYPGDPQGMQIVDGELVSAPAANFSCFWIDGSGMPCLTNVRPQFNVRLSSGRSAPFGLNEARADDACVLYTSANGASTRTIGGVEIVLGRDDPNGPWLPLRVGETYQARVQRVREKGDGPLDSDTMVLSVGPNAATRISGVKPGDTLTISTATWPNMRGSTLAIGGGPALVRGHAALAFRGAQPRHPRTAAGWNKEYFFLVEVDGRQPSSVGMSFAELAAYMAGLGCDEALNLDGGASATFWCDGKVLNTPSEGKERPTVNALVVVQRSDSGIMK